MAYEEFAFVDHLGQEVVVQGEEEFFVSHDFLFLGFAVYGLKR
jgi:hypothetical protein